MNKRLICLTTAVLLAGATLAGAASPTPVSWWKLDEMSGAATIDAVTGVQGVLTGDPAWVEGQFNGALQFDGVDDFVTLPIGSLIGTLSDTTITTWADFSNAGGAWQRIWDFGSGSGDNPYMFLCARVNTDGVIRFAIRTATVGEQVVNSPDRLPSGWHNVSVSIDSQAMQINLYVDGNLVASGATTVLPKDMGETTQNWLGKSQWPDALYQGSLDDVRIFDTVLTQDEIQEVMVGGYGLASDPSPAQRAANTLPNVVLSWTAGPEAKTHDVYFGTSADAVIAASAENPMDVLVSAGQEGTTYTPGALQFATTYYWRVDEVSEDGTIYAGNVWSFTVEPVAYTLGAASIKATASSSNDATMGPEKTIDGSGLDAAGLHSAVETDMWLSANDGPQPTWIQYEFDDVYGLSEMRVWNSNQAMEAVIGYGAASVVVEYSADGAAWTSLGEKEFAAAPGEPGYAANTTVDFGGVPAKFVKLTINSNWGGVLPQYGLSEVRFSYVPAKPTNLAPADGATNLDSPVALSWRPGRQVVTHEVYLGTDAENLPLVATTAEPVYTAAVAVGNTYYWKVVEVNEAAATPRWDSAVQSFSTVAVPTNPGTDNLTHQWTFNDGTADDSVGGLNGTLVGGAEVVDGALVTTAQDQWMEMDGAALAINTYDAFSIVAWYTPTAGANTGYHMLCYFGDSLNGFGSNGFFFTPARGNDVSRAGISCGDVAAPWGAETGVDGPETDDGKPHLAVVTIDATTVKFYMDGVLLGSAPLSAANKISALSTNFAYLAKGGYTADPEWIGKIHEFSIYNKVLTGGEVLYLSQMVPSDPGTDSLTHQWTFDDGTTSDSVGGLTGTLVGGAAVVDGALVTSAQDQWMEMDGAALAINTYEAFSIAGWYTPQAGVNTGYHMLCYFGDSLDGFGSNGFFFTPARGNDVSRAGISCGDVAAPWAAETGVDGVETDDDQMHFVVVTIDATNVTYYLDGEFVGAAALSAANKISALSTNFAYLAKGGYTGDPEWLGAIDEFRVYNKALTISEVRFLAGAE